MKNSWACCCGYSLKFLSIFWTPVRNIYSRHINSFTYKGKEQRHIRMALNRRQNSELVQEFLLSLTENLYWKFGIEKGGKHEAHNTQVWCKVFVFFFSQQIVEIWNRQSKSANRWSGVEKRGSGIKNRELKIVNENPKSRIWDRGFCIEDLGLGILNRGFGIMDFKSRIWYREFGVRNSRSRIGDLGSGIWNMKFGT